LTGSLGKARSSESIKCESPACSQHLRSLLILAKAYSIVRGSRENEDVPLDGFFEVCAPLIGIIPPSEYQLDIVCARKPWESEGARSTSTSHGIKLELTINAVNNAVSVIPVGPMAANQVVTASQPPACAPDMRTS
jgi:hypothetical protein